MTTTAILTSLVILAAIQIVFTQQQNSCQTGTSCSQDKDCVCGVLICNYAKKCNTMSFFDKIIRNQPCYPVFKSRCKTDDDCPCTKVKLMCEDRECVRAKKKKSSISNDETEFSDY